MSSIHTSWRKTKCFRDTVITRIYPLHRLCSSVLRGAKECHTLYVTSLHSRVQRVWPVLFCAFASTSCAASSCRTHSALSCSTAQCRGVSLQKLRAFTLMRECAIMCDNVSGSLFSTAVWMRGGCCGDSSSSSGSLKTSILSSEFPRVIQQYPHTLSYN